MQTRKNRVKRRKYGVRGGSKKVRFSNVTPEQNYAEHAIHGHPEYLRNLREMVRSRIPEPSQIQTNDAEVLATVIETHDDPEEMIRALHTVYGPEELTPEEFDLANRLIKGRGFGTAINVLDSSTIPVDKKNKILNYVRYARAIRKVNYMFFRKNLSHPRFIHTEWGPNTDE
jgi:hypothetical protein